MVNGRLKIEVIVNSDTKISSNNDKGLDLTKYKFDLFKRDEYIFKRTITFFHESFIHANLYTLDYLDNKKVDNSVISKMYRLGNPSNWQHYQVQNNTQNDLWPGQALRGLLEANHRLMQSRYPKGWITSTMWDYDGGGSY